MTSTSDDLIRNIGSDRKFGSILVDPPWRFQNRTGKVAPEHQRLRRYTTMSLDEISDLPVRDLAAPMSHLYLWIPNALLPWGLEVMSAWGFTYKGNIVWHKIRKDGGPDGRGVGFYFRNVTELVLFGVRGSLRTLAAGRRQVNIIRARKREHSRKPDELYQIIEACSPGPHLELFARHRRPGWTQWGNELSVVERPYPPVHDVVMTQVGLFAVRDRKRAVPQADSWRKTGTATIPVRQNRGGKR